LLNLLTGAHHSIPLQIAYIQIRFGREKRGNPGKERIGPQRG
jgi:hypothetical protein